VIRLGGGPHARVEMITDAERHHLHVISSYHAASV
jgi:hypothetical protein